MTTVPQVWGVLNLTPDSFSDGGHYTDVEVAVLRARAMVAEGADCIDVGGESTRPGALRISPEEEQRRIVGTVSALVGHGVPVSVDTMNSSTARMAIDLGARVINDVSAGAFDPDMLSVIAQSGVDYVMMHRRGDSASMDDLAHYDSVAGEVVTELRSRVDAAVKAGISTERIIIDPGLGFAKNPGHNWELVRDMDQIVALGFRVLVGASRKRFLGEILPAGHDPAERDAVTATLGAVLARSGVWALRVHNVQAQRQALWVWQASQRGSLS